MQNEVVKHILSSSKNITEEEALKFAKRFNTPEEFDEWNQETTAENVKEYLRKEEEAKKPYIALPEQTDSDNGEKNNSHTDTNRYRRRPVNGKPKDFIPPAPPKPDTGDLPPSGGDGGGRQPKPSPPVVTITASTRHTDPDENKATEVAAVAFVLENYPHLKDMNKAINNNEGFDLYDSDQDLYIEVKGISGAFGSVTMTSAQFDCALQKRDKFWLYVVEHAQSDSQKLYRLHDPAGFENLRLAFRNDPTMGWETD